MQCPSCGNEAHGKFCAKCGGRLPEQSVAGQGTSWASVGVDPESTTRLSEADRHNLMAVPAGSASRPQQNYPLAPPRSVIPARPDTPSFAAEGAYPVQLLIDTPPSSSRFWAIPLLGIVAKIIVLIPHFLALYVMGLAVFVLQLVTWIPVLFTGKYPSCDSRW